MNLAEALQNLEQGSAMYRTGWELQDGYLTLMPGMSHEWKIVLKPAPNAGNYMWSHADLKATDWEIYKLEEQSAQVIEVTPVDA